MIELSFESGEPTFVAFMPAPIANREADEAAQFSVGALDTRWKLPPHAAHLAVAMPVSGHGSPMDRLSRFTSLLAAIVQATPAVGVYWGDAGATHGRDFFLSVAKDRSIVPRLMLWTGVSITAEDEARISYLSLGMSQLDFPDLLLVARKSRASSALEMVFDLLVYVAKRGEPLPEGDTVGRTADERLPVHYVPSPLGKDVLVWRVELHD